MSVCFAVSLLNFRIFRLPGLLAASFVLLSASATGAPSSEVAQEEGVGDFSAEAEESADPWCYPGDGVEVLTPTVCHFSPPSKEPASALVIFLHGITRLGTTWQHNGHRQLVRLAKANGFSVIMPRGRLGAGSKKFAKDWNWPTSARGQKQFEKGVLAEWESARKILEIRNGKPFERVYVWGFSAGAYYAASLALRGRLGIDGYGIFAGGGAPKNVERWARGIRPKPPVYVGYGLKDKARKDPARLGRALRRMRWPAKIVPRRRVGHSLTDAQAREAFRYLEKLAKRKHRS